jgi:hypothetical protein
VERRSAEVHSAVDPVRSSGCGGCTTTATAAAGAEDCCAANLQQQQQRLSSAVLCIGGRGGGGWGTKRSLLVGVVVGVFVCLGVFWGGGQGGGGSCQPVPGSSGPTILQCTCVTRGVWWDNLTCAWIGPDPFFWQLGRTRHFVCANAFVCVNAACRIANGCLGLVAGPLVQPSQYSSPSVSTFFHSVGIYTLCVVAASSHCCSATLVAPSLSSLLCVSAVCVE